MKALQTEIYQHDSDVDVTHKTNSIELDNWINHLNYIKKELKNLIALCGKGLNNKLDSKSILLKFKKKEAENEILLHALHKYVNSRRNIIECEDTHCDMAYITKHENYRRGYLYHLDKYRKVKDEFYSKVQGKIIIESKISTT